MKRIILSAAFALVATLGFSQKKIKEGSITYQVKYELPANMQQMKAMFPEVVKVYFKGDSSVAQNKTGMATSNFIMNPKTDFQRLLLEIPMMGKKYSVRFTPDDMETIKESLPEFTVTEGTGTKTVATYSGKKYIVTDKASGETSDAVFTNELDIPANSLSFLFDKKYGFPLEFTSSQQGMAVRAVVKEIKEEKVPAGIFSASKDYEEITYSQLQGMMGGRK
jgi:hypothetical protein